MRGYVTKKKKICWFLRDTVWLPVICICVTKKKNSLKRQDQKYAFSVTATLCAVRTYPINGSLNYNNKTVAIAPNYYLHMIVLVTTQCLF